MATLNVCVGGTSRARIWIQAMAKAKETRLKTMEEDINAGTIPAAIIGATVSEPHTC